MVWAQPQRKAHQLGKVQEFVRQIVYGGNDGIVTTFAIVAGFAGASAEGVAQIGGLAVMVFGLANLLADAVSMGLGEFLSGRAQHDLYRRRRGQDIGAIDHDPETERRRLEAQLQARGLSAEEARSTSGIAAAHPAFMAELLMGYETGLRDPAGENPAVNGLVTFGSFVTFGCVPLIPYFLFAPGPGVFLSSVLATLTALAALGLLRWSATGERLGRTLAETMAVGVTCAVVAYGVGWLVGG